jgi:hypothetical protein
MAEYFFGKIIDHNVYWAVKARSSDKLAESRVTGDCFAPYIKE